MATEKNEFPEIGSAVKITGDGSGYQREILKVGKDAELLCVTVTSNTALEKEVNSKYFRLVSPNGEVAAPTERGKNGQQVYLIKDPAEGEWEISIEGTTHDIEINASVVKRGWREKLKRAAWKTSCKTCTIVLRGLIIALLLHLGGVVVSATIIAAISTALHLTGEVLKGFLEFLSELLGFNEGVDRIMEKACQRLGYCGPDYY